MSPGCVKSAWVRCCLSSLGILLVLVFAGPVRAADPAEPGSPVLPAQLDHRVVAQALVSLLVAAFLGGLLAFGQRRRALDRQSLAAVHTLVILAVVGAAVMIVVGASTARAFGIIGVASLVRYRVKIQDPKEASVLLAALAVGLASGVGLYWLAALSALVTLAVLWLLEFVGPGLEDAPAEVSRPHEVALFRRRN